MKSSILSRAIQTLKHIKWTSYFISFLLAALALLFSELLVHKNEKTQQAEQFEKLIETIEVSLNHYLNPMQGLAGLMHVKNYQLSYADYLKFIESRNQYHTYSGSLGFGFIRRIPIHQINSYVKRQKLERPQFEIRNVQESDVPQSLYYKDIVEFIEPIAGRERAAGLDVSTESKRLEALIRSQKTGQPSLTKLVRFSQTKGEGVLYLLPVFKTASPLLTEMDRENNLVGWVYTPILVKEMIQTALERNDNKFHLTVDQMGDDSLSTESLFKSAQADSVTTMDHSKEIDLAGQKWMIKAKSTQQPKLIHFHLTSFFIFIIVLLSSLLIKIHLESIQKEILIRNQSLEAARKEISQHLTEIVHQRNFQEKIINGMPTMVAYYDKNLTLAIGNNSYSQYFKKAPHQLIGSRLTDLLPEDVYLKTRPHLEKALRGETVEYETSYEKEVGKTSHVIVKLVPDIVQSQVQGFLLLSFDITNLKQLEKDRKVIEGQLVAKSKMSSLGEMAGGIAHEINNPLAIISGKVQRLRKTFSLNRPDQLDIPDIHISLEKIDQTIERIAKIVRGLKTFSREAESSELSVCCLKNLIDETLELCQERFKSRSIKMTVNCPAELEINCNSVQISQVMMNLMVNSFDAIEKLKDKWLTVMVTSSDKHVWIELTDSGHGIPPAIAEKMMQPFFTTKEIGKGTGLGLSISKGIIESHGGQLVYDSSSKNTRFIIELPRRSEFKSNSSKQVA